MHRAAPENPERAMCGERATRYTLTREFARVSCFKCRRLALTRLPQEDLE